MEIKEAKGRYVSKYLITGANGFVGKALIELLGEKAIPVTREGSSLSEHHKNISIEINSTTDWKNYLEDIEVVVHLAGIAHKKGISADEYSEVNHLGTLKLAAEAAKSGVKRFIFISTIGVLGAKGTFNDDSIPAPHNQYALSKLDAENGLRKISLNTGMELVIIRPPLVYGTDAPGNFGLLCKIVRKIPILPFGLTRNRRSFISRENLVDLILTCSQHPKADKQIFLASESGAVSTKDFTDAIAQGLGKKIIQLPIPPLLIKLIFYITKRSNLYSQLFDNLEIKTNKLKNVLDWTPKYTMQTSMNELKRKPHYD